MPSSVTLMLALCCGADLASSFSSFVTPVGPSSVNGRGWCTPTHDVRRRPANNSASSTAVTMGLKSFIWKRVARSEDDDDEDVKEDGDATMVDTTRAAEPEHPRDDNGNNNVSDEDDLLHESVQDRIDRLKKGGMTEEEKVAFLQTALSRTSLNKGGRPVIRQTSPLLLPKLNTPSPGPAASPFPSDALWNTVIGAGSPKSQVRSDQDDDEDKGTSDGKGNGLDGGMDDAQKRAWFNMVTSPDRFKNYSATVPAVGVTPSITEQDDAVDETSSSEVEEEEPMVTAAAIVDETSVVPKTTLDDPAIVEEEEQVVEAAKEQVDYFNAVKDSTLASRLEQAAMQQEKAAADARLRRDQEREERELLAREEQRRQRERITREKEELLQRERAELTAKRQAKEEAERQEKEQRRHEQDKLRRKMEEAQDKYWTDKLAKEKEAKQARITTEDDNNKTTGSNNKSNSQQTTFDNKAAVAAVSTSSAYTESLQTPTTTEENTTLPDKTPTASITPRHGSPMPSSPRRSRPNVMKESARGGTASSSTTVLKKRGNTNTPGPSDTMAARQSKSDFLEEQQRKKTALEEMLRRQKLQLSRLNSPLPSPGSSGPGVRPRVGSTHGSVSAASVASKLPPLPSSASPKTVVTEEVVVTPSTTSPTPTKSPEKAAPMRPIFDWRSMGNSKGSSAKDTATTTSLPRKGKVDTVKEINTASTNTPLTTTTAATTPDSLPPPRLSLREMTRFKGTASSSTTSTSTKVARDNKQKPPPSAPRKPTTSPRKPTASTTVQNKKKAPIRQTLNINDDDDAPNKRQSPIRQRLKLDDDDNKKQTKSPIRMKLSLDDDEPATKATTTKPIIPDDQKAKAKSWGINLDLLM